MSITLTDGISIRHQSPEYMVLCRIGPKGLAHPGYATIDWKHRAYCIGWRAVEAPPARGTHAPRFTGRGWRDKLVQAAIQHLRESAA